MKKVKINYVWFRVGQVLDAEEFYSLLKVSDFVTLEEILKNKGISIHRTETEVIAIGIEQLGNNLVKINEIEKQYL